MASYPKGAAIGPDLEVAKLQKEGVTTRAVDAVADPFGVTKRCILAVVDASASADDVHARREAAAPRRVREPDAAVRLHSIAARTLPKPAKWFLEETLLLAGPTPLDGLALVVGDYNSSMERLAPPPTGWDDRLHHSDVRETGDTWAAKGGTWALGVPSVLLPV